MSLAPNPRSLRYVVLIIVLRITKVCCHLPGGRSEYHISSTWFSLTRPKCQSPSPRSFADRCYLQLRPSTFTRMTYSTKRGQSPQCGVANGNVVPGVVRLSGDNEVVAGINCG